MSTASRPAATTPRSISEETIRKLTHEIPEIRERALKSIDAKLAHENFAAQPSNKTLLLKNLLRWFGLKPSSPPERALALLLRLVDTPNIYEQITILGREKILKDLNKIEKTLSDADTRTNLRRIRTLVQTSNAPASTTDTTATSSSATVNMMSSIDLITSSLAKCQLDADELQQSTRLSYETAWQRPSISDLNSMRQLNRALRNVDDEAGFKHALGFLVNACADLPGEYFLQPPYIALNVHSLLAHKNGTVNGDIVEHCTRITRAIHRRILQRFLQDTQMSGESCASGGGESATNDDRYQITANSYLRDTLRTAIEHLNAMIHAADEDDAQQVIIRLFEWISELMELAELMTLERADTVDFRGPEQIGYMLRYFRQLRVSDRSMEFRFWARRMYLMLVHVLCRWLCVMPDQLPAERDNICNIELEFGVLDAPLRNECENLWLFMHDFYVNHLSPEHFDHINALLNASETLQPAVALLNDPEDMVAGHFVDPLLQNSLAASETLSVVNSIGLCDRLFKRVILVSLQFGTNPELRKNGELLLLRLLAHASVDVRRATYVLCTVQMVQYMASCVQSMKQKSRRPGPSRRGAFLGIPLSEDILVEMICFGEPSTEPRIQECAANMLTMVLKFRKILSPDAWQDICSMLLAVLPLLQTNCHRPSALCEEILAVLTPSDSLDTGFVMPLVLFSGNVRLLFATQERVRCEAIARLLYMLDAEPDAGAYLPKVSNVTDVIPNDLCIKFGSPPWDAELAAAAPSLYDAATFDQLVAILAGGGAVEPAIRRSTLLQLGALLANPKLCARFEQLNGIALACNALRNACLNGQHMDYPDAAVAAVVVLCRLCVNSAICRSVLVYDEVTLRCVLRAMLLFVQNEELRREGAVLLFLVTHASCVEGETRVSVPALLQQRLAVPLVHVAHMADNPFTCPGELERELAKGLSKAEWQCLRFAFSETSMGNMLQDQIDSQQQELQYAGLRFDDRLRLTAADIALRRCTDMGEMLAVCTKALENATTHTAVGDALANIAIIGAFESFDIEVPDIGPRLTVVLRRFFLVLPNTEGDERCFGSILHVVARLMRSNGALLAWMLEQMCRKSCPLLTILRGALRTGERLFREVCVFLQDVWSNAQASTDEQVKRKLSVVKMEGFETLADCYYETIVGLLDDVFATRILNTLRALVSLLSCLTSFGSANYPALLRLDDAEAATFLINKLLRIVATVRSRAQTGASFNRHSLRSVCNVMHMVTRAARQRNESPPVYHVHDKYVRLLSGLCGHGDREVRSLAWAVLIECAQSYAGAVQLVKELEYLPGGFHACALSTAFDTEECSLVRCAAGAVFAELLGHVNAAGSGRVLWPRYAGQPAAGAAAAAEDTAEPDSVSANNGVAAVDECVTCIVELLECHRFAVTWDDALSVFWRLTESGDHNRSHASWRLLRMFCTIGVQMVRLGKESAVHELQGEFRLVNGVLRLLAAIQKVPSYRSVHLLVEICRFVAAAMRWAADMLETLVQEEPTVVTALLQMMRPSFYEDVSDELAAMALGGLCRLFVPLSTHGMCVIEVADQSVEHVKTLMRLAAYALDGERSDHFAASVLVILQNMVQCTATSADGSSEALHPFCDLLDTVMVEDERKKGSDPESAAKMCFRVLNALRKRSKNSPLEPAVVQTIALLLQHSSRARRAAATEKLFDDILSDLDAVLTKLNGVSCADFTRRFGDAKKDPIMRSIRHNITILMHWLSRAHMFDSNADESFPKALLIGFTAQATLLWPWIVPGGDQRLQLDFLSMLAYVSEDSLPVCKLFATAKQTRAKSMLQLCAEYVTGETQRPKKQGADLAAMGLAMRVLCNCCAAVEGRQALQKIGFLNAIDRLHPMVTKHQRPWPEVTRLWLRFYEILTRHTETNTTGVKHLSLLCTFVLKPNMAALGAELRLQALSIIRNMAFAAVCRSALIASEELIYVFRRVLDQNPVDAADQQLLVCHTIWRLLANSYAAKHMLRATTLPSRLAKLADRVANDRNAGDELALALQMPRLLLEK